MQELSRPWLSKPSLILSYVIAALSGAAATAIELLLDAFMKPVPLRRSFFAPSCSLQVWWLPSYQAEAS
jgi:hypothetical protein